MILWNHLIKCSNLHQCTLQVHRDFSHDSFNSKSMFLTRSTGKFKQESHDVDDIGSGTTSGIPKATNDDNILCSFNIISIVLEEFYTFIIRYSHRITVKIIIFS